MAYTEGYRIDFRSGGDTVSEAISKHIAEITRMYGILNELKNNDLTPSELEYLKTGSISGSRIVGNIAGSIDGSHITGTVNAGIVSGNLGLATIAAGNVSGLSAFVKGLIPSDTGGSSSDVVVITQGDIGTNGDVKFGNGLIVQWGQTNNPTTVTENWTAYDVTFPQVFPNACYNVMLTVQGGTDVNLVRRPSNSGFRASVSGSADSNTILYYLAIGA